MTWRVFTMSFVAGLAALLQFEVKNDVLCVEKEVVLPGSRAKTFLYLTDLRNLKYWFPGVDGFEPVDDSVMGVGKQFIESSNFQYCGNMTSSCTVLGYEAPHYLSYVCDSWFTRPRFEMTLTTNDDNPKYPTTLVYREFSRRRSYMFNYVISPLVSHVYGFIRRQALFALRHNLQDR